MSKAQIELTAVDQTKGAIDSARRNLRGLGDQVTALPAAFSALGISFAAAFAVNSLKGVIDSADALNKLSQKSGLATEDLSQLQYAAKLADVSNDTLATSIKKLNISIAEGLAGDKEKIALFKSLGISTADLGKGTKEVFLQIADAYSKGKDGAGKVAAGNGLMGKSAEDMIPLLNGGRQGITALMLEAQKMGLTISTDFAKNAEEFNDNLTRLQVSGNNLAITLAGDLVRGLGETMKAMADAAIEGGKLSGIIAGMQMLFTGNDRYKNDKSMVELTDNILQAENKLLKSRHDGTKGITKDTEERLASLKAELKTTLSYRGVLDASDATTAAAKAKAAADDKKKQEIKLQPKGDGGASAANRELKEEAKLLLELAGLTGTFSEDWDRLTRLFAKGKLSLQQLTDEQARLLGMQPAIRKANEEQKKHQEDLERGEDRNKQITKRYLDGIDSENDALAKNNKSLQEHVEEIGLTGAALDAVRLARLDSNIARQEEMVLLASSKLGDEAEVELLERKLGLMREERNLTATAAGKEVKATEDADNKRRTEGLSQSISEGLLDGFRDGKSFGDIFLNELKAQFAKTVLQPVISPIVQMGNDALGGMFKGMGGGMGGISNMSLGSLFTDFGGTASAGNGMVGAIGDLVSFDGGGYTGGGLRTGGLDGIGGFMAMVHPDETIVDHTKGQNVGGSVVNNYSFGAGVSRAEAYEGYRRARAEAVNDVREGSRRRRG
ncbi:MAG: hypothetical protein JWQ72_3837 [Polaromonas sp.]|nr:hypothetical protein [Polaromonas sp.]